MTIQPNGMLVELDKTEFLEIVNNFIKKHSKEYKKFCKGVAG